MFGTNEHNELWKRSKDAAFITKAKQQHGENVIYQIPKELEKTG